MPIPRTDFGCFIFKLEDNNYVFLCLKTRGSSAGHKKKRESDSDNRVLLQIDLSPHKQHIGVYKRACTQTDAPRYDMQTQTLSLRGNHQPLENMENDNKCLHSQRAMIAIISIQYTMRKGREI